MKKQNKFISGIFGLISGVLLIAASIALILFVYVCDNSSTEGFLIFVLVMVAVPAMILVAAFAITICGLSIGTLVIASKNKANVKVLIALATFEIISALEVAIVTVLVFGALQLFVLYLITTIIITISAILTLILLKRQASK